MPAVPSGARMIVRSDPLAGLRGRRLLLCALGGPIVLGWLWLGQRAGLHEISFGAAFVVLSSVVILVGIRDISERKRAEEELKASRERLLALSRRLIEVQEAERRHIARELHDEIGQELTALKINLQAAHQLGGDAELASRLEDSMGVVERAIQQVRDMSLALRPSLLDDLGLVAALRWYVDHQAQRSGFEARLKAEPARIRVSPYVEIGCYRVVQEALNNVARHAQAHSVRVELALREGKLRLLIQDDGVGFDVKAARERARRGTSMGLLTMPERARLLGGYLKVESAPGRGTEIRAVFPASPAS
ncbi:MAG: sensor histidine kinase [Thermoanaerobaculia bacterium]